MFFVKQCPFAVIHMSLATEWMQMLRYVGVHNYFYI